MTDNRAAGVAQSEQDGARNAEVAQTLKPCPFCGSADDMNLESFAVESGCNEGDTQWISGCLNCGASFNAEVRSEVIAAWNRRPISSAEPVASLRELVRKPGLIDALRLQRQCDEEGVECIVSRQACDEAAQILTELSALLDRMPELGTAGGIVIPPIGADACKVCGREGMPTGAGRYACDRQDCGRRDKTMEALLSNPGPESSQLVAPLPSGQARVVGCGHDDSSWCDDKCAQLNAKRTDP